MYAINCKTKFTVFAITFFSVIILFSSILNEFKFSYKLGILLFFFLCPVELLSDHVTTPKYLGNHCRITSETISKRALEIPHQAAWNLATSPRYVLKIQ